VTRPVRVAVIGAGIGGLAAACALRQHGCEVADYERSSELGEVGAGLQLGPKAVKVLRALGIEDELRALASEPTNIVSLTWDSGAVRFREPLKAVAAVRFGAPYLTVHRADLHRLLREKLPAEAIHLDAMCVEVSSSARAAVASFAGRPAIEADVVVGADGIRSVVREKLFGVQPARFTQQTAWRGMVPIDCVPRQIGRGGMVRVERHEYVGWIGPTGHVICYPIRGGELYNIFAGRVSEEWAEESWTVPSSVDRLLAAYQGWNDALLAMFGKIERCFRWGIYDRDPLPQWTKGRVTLLGDAAHPMMPTLAQGAAVTLEDAFALARHLANRRDDPARALLAYQAERVPRASKVQLQARTQFDNNRKVPAPPPLDRDWIFEHDATAQPMAAAE
jgi:2-polyprenyl-6-methoxyphenol hydroxylase-like FAD-dependent oxidoreductase